MATTTASIPAYLLPGVPVVQPPHLEGDASLATEILPGPPSAATVQQMALKRDPRKPSMAYSYLPPSDPGSTYSGIMHGTLIGLDPDGACSKHARDKATSGRAQRASARHQGSNLVPTPDTATTLPPSVVAITQPPPIDSDTNTMLVDEEPGPVLSRSTSSVNLQPQDPPGPTNNRQKRKDKGKGKEVEIPLRIKEEPRPLSLHTPEPANNLLNNEDHCSSCRSSGSLVYCDGCPKAFHLWCLDPPLESVDDARWFCPTCTARKHPPRKPPPSLCSAIIHHIQVTHPVEFQLPEEIRTFFKDVGSGPRGSYVDTSEVRPPRLNRHGQLEDRDPYRLRDRNGGPVLCYQCGQSALPTNLSSSAPATKRPRRSTSKAASPDAWKSMVSCDYCNLHWHLDCLDPPLPTLPAFNKKWMCPNHGERVLPPKRRIPKHHAPPIEITKPRQFNNGNIDVIHTTTIRAAPVPVDEVLINGRRYRVPEKIIVLDFWNKLKKSNEPLQGHSEGVASRSSSPLTELSSLDDEDYVTSLQCGPLVNGDFDEDSAARVLCDLSSKWRGNFTNALALPSLSNIMVDRSVQTESDVNTSPVVKNKVGRPRKHPLAPESTISITGRTLSNMTSEPAATSSISTLKRKRAYQNVLPEPSSRQLRSRSRIANTESSITSTSSLSSVPQVEDLSSALSGTILTLTATHPQPKNMNVKLEEVETTLNHSVFDDTDGPLPASSKARVIRTPRQAVAWQKVALTREKRGRKRKTLEEDLPGDIGVYPNFQELSKSAKVEDSETVEREPRKLARTPSRPDNAVVPHQSPRVTSVSATPSLKIRLPRLNTAASSSSINLESPTRR